MPFFFAYRPELLLIGSPGQIAIVVVGAAAGFIFFIASVEGYLLKRMRVLERVVLAIASITLLVGILSGEGISAIVGAAIITLFLFWQVKLVRSLATGSSAPQSGVNSIDEADRRGR